ncbi:MAG: DEAD/DEAH box helicase [Sphingopyxis sp.]
MTFADLGLSDELLRAVTEAGYAEPTPIQAAAIPQVQMMRDLVAIAQTGTGKTASFVLPMIDILAHGRTRARMPRSLILEPTRELAAQVAENFEKYGKYHKLSMALLIGGVQMGDQVKALEKGVDVLIATPGRLMDLFQRGKIMLNDCTLLVIDEADRMLDMGFIPDIEEICTKLPKDRQTLLFSATMPPVIKRLADKFLTNPRSVEVARPASSNLNITQALVKVDERKKGDVVRKLLRSEPNMSTIIFCNRKTMVRDLAKSLQRDGFRAGEIHGDMDQSSRIAELDRFKAGDVTVLVASDVAARGLDVKGVSHVINYDTPWHPDDYVHRIGRTGRAGAKGHSYTFVTTKDAEAIDNVQKLIGVKIPWDDGLSGGGAKGAPSEAVEDQAAETKQSRPSRSIARPAKIAPGNETEAPAMVALRDDNPKDAAPKGDSAPAKSRAAKPRPAPKGDAKPKKAQPEEQRPPRFKQQDAEEDGGWNGPMPGFLGVGFGR